MIFKELLYQSTWENICSALLQLFPDHAKYMASYRIAYNNLKRLDQSGENRRLTIGISLMALYLFMYLDLKLNVQSVLV